MLKVVAMPKPSLPRRSTRPSSHSPQAPHTFELVELRWILKALGAVVGLALLCGFVTLCVVYSRTQWQLVLNPSHEIKTTPASLGLAFTEVHFGPDDTGQPQLDGWWISSDNPTDPTVLLLHSGDGSMSDALPQTHALHSARLNVLLFDYRGYGHSGGNHPTEATMEADANSALSYLTDTHGIPAGSIIVYGSGVGGSLAVRLCAEHQEIPALVLESPRGDLKARALADNRSGFIPARLLFTQDFPLAGRLHVLTTPKLLISYTSGQAPLELQRAADPKMTVELPANDTSAFQQTLRRFLDTYIARPPTTLSPQP
jgi:pimeloyl-ACP methyl ester carboxylesterase